MKPFYTSFWLEPRPKCMYKPNATLDIPGSDINDLLITQLSIHLPTHFLEQLVYTFFITWVKHITTKPRGYVLKGNKSFYK